MNVINVIVQQEITLLELAGVKLLISERRGHLKPALQSIISNDIQLDYTITDTEQQLAISCYT